MQVTELSKHLRRSDGTVVVYHAGRLVGFRREGCKDWMQWHPAAPGENAGHWTKAGPTMAVKLENAPYRGELRD